MPTIVVNTKKHTDRKWISVLVALILGTSVGVLVGASNGGAIAALRYKNKFVPREDYDRVCEYANRVGLLYFAERQRNVQLTGRHEVAHKIFDHPPRPQVATSTALTTDGINHK